MTTTTMLMLTMTLMMMMMIVVCGLTARIKYAGSARRSQLH